MAARRHRSRWNHVLEQWCKVSNIHTRYIFMVYIYSKYLICFRILISNFFFFLVGFTISQFSNNVPLLPVSILYFWQKWTFPGKFHHNRLPLDIGEKREENQIWKFWKYLTFKYPMWWNWGSFPWSKKKNLLQNPNN